MAICHSEQSPQGVVEESHDEFVSRTVQGGDVSTPASPPLNMTDTPARRYI